MARTLDLWAALDPYNWSPNGAVADARAMAVDWSVVGHDLADAMNIFAAGINESDSRQLKLIFPAND
jgi:hypothetical protein